MKKIDHNAISDAHRKIQVKDIVRWTSYLSQLDNLAASFVTKKNAGNIKVESEEASAAGNPKKP